MIPIVTPAEMRAIDAAAIEPLEELIERAGRALARRARTMMGGVYGRRVVAIAGPGNNGADATVAARVLQSWGARVEIVPPDVGVLPGCDLVIDGAYGTGTNRGYVPPAAPAGAAVLAVDIPSGIDGLTGERIDGALRATCTVTFAALKPGTLLADGAALSGDVEVADIGLDTSRAHAWLFTEHDARIAWPWRPPDMHKWKRSVYVIGGSAGMFGAPLLASRAALRAGAGIVWCGLPGQSPPPIPSEVVFRELPQGDWHESVLAEASRFGAMVIGCGLGLTSPHAESLQHVVGAEPAGRGPRPRLPVVLDGDALRALGPTPRLRPEVVLTPHDGEFEALSGRRPDADRFGAVRALAAATGAVVLLKGPLTIVGDPHGRCIAVDAGDARLATAGSGDVLAGIIGANLAAGLDSMTAAALGAWTHAMAGSATPFGMVASDLIDGLPTVAAELRSPAHPPRP